MPAADIVCSSLKNISTSDMLQRLVLAATECGLGTDCVEPEVDETMEAPAKRGAPPEQVAKLLAVVGAWRLGA